MKPAGRSNGRRRKRQPRRLYCLGLAGALLLGVLMGILPMSRDAAAAGTTAIRHTLAPLMLQLDAHLLALRMRSAARPDAAGRLSEVQVRAMVAALFPASAQERFLQILRCENATYEPARIGWNRDGSYDVGLAQINSVHRERVERLFGEPFDVAMRDPWKNLRYAALKYEEEGERPWTCSRVV